MNCRLKLKTPHNFCYPHNFCITTKKKKKGKINLFGSHILSRNWSRSHHSPVFSENKEKKKLHNSKPLHVEQNCTPSKMPVTVPCLLHSAMQTYL